MSNDKRKDIEEERYFDFETCEGHFFEPILDATGEIKVCMYHYGDDRFTFGNINEHRFLDIWLGDRRRNVIEFVRGFDYRKGCQLCCKCTEINKLTTFINNPSKDMDVNFL